MMFDFNLRIRAGHIPPSGISTGGAMSDWSNDIIGKLKQKQENESVKDKKFLEQQRIRREQGPLLWNAVKSAVTKLALELKQSSGGKEIVVVRPDAQPFNVVVGTPDGQHTVSATFNQGTDTLTWASGMDSHIGWRVIVSEDGSANFNASSGEMILPDAIARKLLEALLGV
jgi:hypothetical protein